MLTCSELVVPVLGAQAELSADRAPAPAARSPRARALTRSSRREMDWLDRSTVIHSPLVTQPIHDCASMGVSLAIQDDSLAGGTPTATSHPLVAALRSVEAA